MALPQGEYWWVYLRPDNLQWVQRKNSDTAALSSGSCNLLSEVPAPAGARMVLCVPGESVRVHVVDLPARKRSQFISALPYALEDVLLREPDKYHLCPLTDFRRGNRHSIAVIEHARMSAWIEELRLNDWVPQLLTADYMAIVLPDDNSWMLDVSENPCLLRRSDEQYGTAFYEDVRTEIPAALLLALENASDLPSYIQLRVGNKEQEALVSQWQQQLDSFEIGLQINEDSRSRVTWLSSFPVFRNELNLLSGSYAKNQHELFTLRRAVPALSLLCMILLVLSGQWFYETSRIKTQYETLNEQLSLTLLQAFPEVKNIIDPRFQMQQKIELLQQSAVSSDVKSDLLNWLNTIAPILDSNGKFRLQSLQYDEERLSLELDVRDYVALDELQKSLQEETYITIDNAELVDARVHVRLTMRKRT